jgi:hypothetical protein
MHRAARIHIGRTFLRGQALNTDQWDFIGNSLFQIYQVHERSGRRRST